MWGFCFLQHVENITLSSFVLYPLETNGGGESIQLLELGNFHSSPINWFVFFFFFARKVKKYPPNGPHVSPPKMQAYSSE